MIIGTAGHVDHGKTTLVRALTGVDTDRLKQEKERGISIELGYAYAPLANGDVLGYVDVPGHERFVHTMVAGACGIDFALLVVAADDGVMPQTREHLAILELLGVTHGAVALSKADRVAEARLSEVQEEIVSALAPSALSDAPIFPLNATDTDDPGLAVLRSYLHEVAQRMAPRLDARLFRLAVDRVFTLAGRGTVVTGTVFSGQIRPEDTAMVMPGNMPARVRSVHTQNRPSELGRAGQRCALNLAGIDKNSISRGDWLADARALAATMRIDVRLRLLPTSVNPLQPWTLLHVHLGTAHRVAHVVPLESPGSAPGEWRRVQLVFDTPVCTMPGDRFIVRDAQAARTVGGGIVLDPLAPARRRRSAQRMSYLDALEALIATDNLAGLLEQRPYGLSLAELVRLTGYAPDRVPLPPEALRIEAGIDSFVFLPSHWHALRERAVAGLRGFHAASPDEPGPDVGRLRRIAVPELPDALWRALINRLAADNQLMRSGPWLHLPEHTVTLTPDDEALAHRLQPLIARGRFDPPWVRDLAASVSEPEDRIRKVLRKQVIQGTVYQVVRDLFYDGERIDELADVVAALAREHGAANAAHYRDTLGLGRKRAIQILEFFDRVGYTRRVHDSHILRTDSGWRASRQNGSPTS